MQRKRQASILRGVRKIHRTLGATLFLLFLVVSLSGLLLGWKKNTGGYILPESARGTSAELSTWQPLDTLQSIAFSALRGTVDKDINLDLQRIDARPEKGMVKFVFDNHYWGVQLDGSTGKVLAITRRRSDLVENIHDGSVLDLIFGTQGEILKLCYTSIMGLSLLGFTITGFWLWYGPKVMRRTHRRGDSHA